MTDEQINNIPAELRSIPRWYVYKLTPKKDKSGKPTGKHGKEPADPITGRNACWKTDPKSAMTFEQAVAALRKNKPRNLAGIGFVFTREEPYSGIDIDGCLEADGKPDLQAEQILEEIDTYTEVSRSGTGVHLIVRGKLEQGDDGARHDDGKRSFECYSAGRFFVFTGNVLPGRTEIKDHEEKLRWFRKKYASAPAKKAEPVTPPLCDRPEPTPAISPAKSAGNLDDEKILEIIRRSDQAGKFEALWRGETSGHGNDHSAADAALCSILAFYTHNNAAQIDRLFRRSGLMRDKWNERHGADTYGNITIAKGIKFNGSKAYDPAKGSKAIDLSAQTRQASSEQPTPRPKLQTITAAEIMAKEYPPLDFIIPNILPAVGLTILAGKPKKGKSWLALGLAIAIASGGKAFGRYDVEAGDVLYLALEDGERRLQSRMKKLFAPGESAPKRLDFMTAIPPKLEPGALLEMIRDWRQEHPEAKAVFIDTMAKVRPPTNRNNNVYHDDYLFAGAYQRMALEEGLTVVMIHHTRKASDDDVFTTISGSTGITGAADTMMVVEASGIGADTRKLHITGRDIDERSLVMSFNKSIWTQMADGEEGAELLLSTERRKVLEILRKTNYLSAKQLEEQLQKPQATVSKLLRSMVEAEQICQAGSRGKYYIPFNVGNVGNVGNDGNVGNVGNVSKHADNITNITGTLPEVVMSPALYQNGSPGDITDITDITRADDFPEEEISRPLELDDGGMI